jgi:hypothetical protein
MPSCANCGAGYEAPVYRTSICRECGKELKTCTNCDHYAPGAAHDCREPVSEPVHEKNRSNFCDWFRPATDAGKGAAKKSSADNARKAFSDLFSDD